jgi:hypothetical protein
MIYFSASSAHRLAPSLFPAGQICYFRLWLLFNLWTGVHRQQFPKWNFVSHVRLLVLKSVLIQFLISFYGCWFSRVRSALRLEVWVTISFLLLRVDLSSVRSFSRPVGRFHLFLQPAQERAVCASGLRFEHPVFRCLWFLARFGLRVSCLVRACDSVFGAQASVFPSLNLILVVLCYVMDELLQGDIGIALESLDQKTRGFMV